LRGYKLCSETRFKKCPYGQSRNIEYRTNFKDEPEQFSSYFDCIYREYGGPTSVMLSSMTRREYQEMMDTHTHCTYSKDSESYYEWRCWKCNATVSSERERHRCFKF